MHRSAGVWERRWQTESKGKEQYDRSAVAEVIFKNGDATVWIEMGQEPTAREQQTLMMGITHETALKESSSTAALNNAILKVENNETENVSLTRFCRSLSFSLFDEDDTALVRRADAGLFKGESCIYSFFFCLLIEREWRNGVTVTADETEISPKSVVLK